MQKLYNRKKNRLPGYDYSQNGYYYITVCTYNRECLFGKIINNQMILNDAGEMVDTVIKELPKHYTGVLLDEYMVMTNHVHMVITIINSVGAAPRVDPIQNKILNTGQAQGPVPTQLSLSDIIHRFKSLSANKYIDGGKNDNWKPFNKHLWQRSFHDHIIRNDKSLNNIREYIINNPATWEKDENNIKGNGCIF